MQSSKDVVQCGRENNFSDLRHAGKILNTSTVPQVGIMPSSSSVTTNISINFAKKKKNCLALMSSGMTRRCEKSETLQQMQAMTRKKPLQRPAHNAF